MTAIFRSAAAALLAFVSITITTSSALAATEHGTEQEAIALVKQAVAYYKANGKENTFAEINKPDGQFINKDLYLFVGSTQEGGVTLAHGANAKLLGKNLSEMKDVDGNKFVKRMAEVANSKSGKGWVDYRWPNPTTKELEQKSTYVERVDDIWFACGIYR
ncbi:cache domain-containing protein [Undibacterium terreum]|nr:cache domain-containing protein [Undibacterium terreum]